MQLAIVKKDKLLQIKYGRNSKYKIELLEEEILPDGYVRREFLIDGTEYATTFGDETLEQAIRGVEQLCDFSIKLKKQ